MAVCDCENCSLYNADEFITRPIAVGNGSKNNAKPGLSAGLRDTSMLARAAIIGRVAKEHEARRHSHYIPPPPPRKKKQNVDYDLSKQCFLPCHRASWLMMVSAFVLIAIGATMCNFAFHALVYATEVQTMGNVTVTETNQAMYKGLRSLTYIGPCFMGVGAFLIIVACVVLFDTREKQMKREAAQQAKLQQELSREQTFKAMMEKKAKLNVKVDIATSESSSGDTEKADSVSNKLELLPGPHSTAIVTSSHLRPTLAKTLSAPPSTGLSRDPKLKLSKRAEETLHSRLSSHTPSPTDSLQQHYDIEEDTTSPLLAESDSPTDCPSPGTYFSNRSEGEKNQGYQYSDYSLKSAANNAACNNNDTFVDVDTPIEQPIEQPIVRPKTTRADCARSATAFIALVPSGVDSSDPSNHQSHIETTYL